MLNEGIKLFLLRTSSGSTNVLTIVFLLFLDISCNNYISYVFVLLSKLSVKIISSSSLLLMLGCMAKVGEAALNIRISYIMVDF